MISSKMSTKSYAVVLLQSIIFLKAVINAERCIVVAPRTIRSNSEYSISIATFGLTEPIKFRVKIYEREEETSNKTLDYVPNNKNLRHDPYDDISFFGPKMTPETIRSLDSYSTDEKSDTPITFVQAQSVTVNPDTPELVKFKFDKDVLMGSYVLEVQSLPGSPSEFYEKIFLYVQSTALSIFIQTSKAIYRPGETIKYRILILDSETKPIAVDKSLTISIFDGTQNKIYQLLEQSALRGVYLGEFKTSVEAECGVWEIEAQYKDTQIRKTVELAEYVLPKFLVSAKTPNFISKTSENFSVTVNTRYTFGKPVSGSATIKATPILNTTTSWQNVAKPLEINRDINGELTVNFNVADFELINGHQTYESILIETTVEESATKTVGRAFDKTIIVDSTKRVCKFEIILSYFNFYLPNTQFLMKVQIKPEEGQYSQEGDQWIDFRAVFDTDTFKDEEYSKYKLDADGKCDVLLDVPNDTKKSIKISVKYEDAYEEVVILSKAFHVQLIDKKPKLNEKIKFQIGSIEKLNSVSFYIVGRANLLVLKTIKLTGENIVDFEINSTFAMAPKCSLVAFYITDDGSIVSDITQIEFSAKVMPNSISIEVSDDEVEPKQVLSITVKTENDSDIALTFTDQSLLLMKRGNDLSRTRINNELQNYDSANFGDFDLDEAYTGSYITMIKPGTVVLTDAIKFKSGMFASSTTTPIRRSISLDYYPDLVKHIVIPLPPTEHEKPGNYSKRLLLDVKNVRSTFPEILMWEDRANVNNTLTLETEMPDTVTSWLLNGFSLNSENGLGIPKAPIIVSTFKTFFVEAILPTSVRLDEIVKIPIVVHNYLDEPSKVMVIIEGDFDIVEDGQHDNMVDVPADGVGSIWFKIKPKNTGSLVIEITASSQDAYDKIVKSLLIKPKGIVIRRFITKIITVDEKKNFTDSFNINIPGSAIAGSARFQLAFQGDKYSLLLQNTQNYIQKASGTGLDFINGWLANSVSLNLLGASNQLNCGAKEVAMETISRSLKAQAQYLCEDGGYNSHGDCSDPDRDTWFTSQNVMAVIGSAAYSSIDVSIVKKSLDYLTRIQLNDGSFPEKSAHPLSKTYLNGTTLLTANVLLPFVFVDNYGLIKGQYTRPVEAALQLLFNQLEELDLQSLILLALILQIQNHSDKVKVFEMVQKKTWRSKDSHKFNVGALDPMDTESLAFALYIMQFAERPADGLPIANALIKNMVETFDGRFDFGVIAARQILAEFNRAFQIVNSSIDLAFTTPETPEYQQIHIDDNNRFVLQKFQLPNNVTSIDVKGWGHGFAVVQLNYQYNLEASEVLEKFDVNVEVQSSESKKWNLEICVSFKGDKTQSSSNAVMEISLPAGCDTSEFIQDWDLKSNKIQKKRFRNNDLIVEFKNLDSKPECFNVPLFRTRFVVQQSIGSVLIYDENAITYRTERSYEIA